MDKSQENSLSSNESWKFVFPLERVKKTPYHLIVEENGAETKDGANEARKLNVTPIME